MTAVAIAVFKHLVIVTDGHRTLDGRICRIAMDSTLQSNVVKNRLTPTQIIILNMEHSNF